MATGSFSLKDSDAYCKTRIRRLLRVSVEIPSLRKKLSAAAPTVSVRVVGTAPMQSLNLKYRKKNRPTDVLSFEAHAVFRAQGVLGDLVICHPVAKRQAKEEGHSIKAELDVLLVHGLLHLLGYDHELGAKEAKAMAAMERKVLAELWGAHGRRRASLISRAVPVRKKA